MKKLTLENIDKNEVLRYLGWKDGVKPDENIESHLAHAIELTLKTITPRAVYAYFEAGELAGTGLLDGSDIALHLQGCTGVILSAVTIGGGIEEKIRAAQAADALMPVVVDSCATAAAEALCEEYTDMLAEIYAGKGLCLTGRFSPGYGDFPIEKQHILLRLVDAERKIGLCATKSSILTPRKSVTAVIGVSDKPIKGHLAGCSSCALRDKCEYIRKGTSCNV